jgi:hypothetical protein
MRDLFLAVKMLSRFLPTQICGCTAPLGPVDVPVQKWKESNLPFIKQQ